MSILLDIQNPDIKHAFLIGNGPNLATQLFPSWDELLTSISDIDLPFGTTGLSNTEIYDLIEMNSDLSTDIKKSVCDKLDIDLNNKIGLHRSIVNFAIANSSPILTTNFDRALETSVNAKLYRTKNKGFTRYYPWESYYGFNKLELPTEGFGIWKIHGDVRYKDSIRLGLTDYMGSVERARKLIHNGDDRLFNGKHVSYWKGHKSWLHIWFNMRLIIFGFGLGKDEVFLRWLLIERKRYYNMLNRNMDTRFVVKGTPGDSVKNFLQNLDIEIISVPSYDDIYNF